MAIKKEIGDRLGEANSLANLGIIAAIRSDFKEADRLFKESLAIKQEIGDRRGEEAIQANIIYNRKAEAEEE